MTMSSYTTEVFHWKIKVTLKDDMTGISNISLRQLTSPS